MSLKRLSGWGRYRPQACRVSRIRDEGEARAALDEGPLIARGNGRAYGDSALNPGHTLDMRGMDRMLAFDSAAGVLVAEAGVLLADIIAAFLPRGWFPWVTPGTKFVTLGGAIAADVHGKNHHIDGGFGSFVLWIDVMDAEGTVIRAEPGQALFDWTVGGMGLTGIILRAALRLRPVESAYILQDMRATQTLAATIDMMEGTLQAPYSVAWLDCVTQGHSHGRGLVMLGRHAPRDALPPSDRQRPFHVKPKASLRLPLDLPAAALNTMTRRAFNGLYYKMARRKPGERLIDWDSYFYPLDAILDWNRGYGRAGFLQFQCCLPQAAARAGLETLLRRIAASGEASVLSVLKRFGAQRSRFSFPMAGYTLALDFPVNDRVLKLMAELDAITLDHGGRFYLAKDARMPAAVFEAADPRVAEFRAMRAEAGRRAQFQSLQSERLGL
jgi:FAD/FMN-containing dehydrogenase